MIQGWPYTEYPTGWFQVAWSPQIEGGQPPVPLEYFGRKLVAYRGESGQVHVMDAYCRHMGAHLAFGGTVEGDAVRCPFHGWCWGPDGRNTEIPYGSRSSLKIKMITYPTVEIDGVVLIWFDSTGAPPTWEPPLLTGSKPETTFFDLFPHCIGTDRLRMQPQMMAENIVDFPHLVWTHRWTGGESELVHFSADEHRFVSEMCGFVPTKKGNTKIQVIQNMHGVGLIVAPMWGIRDVVNVAGTTPIDEDYSRVFLSTFVSCPEGQDPAEPDKLAMSIVRAQHSEVIGKGDNGDRKIWENQRYVAHPPMVPEESTGAIAIRSWAKQFYPGAVKD